MRANNKQLTTAQAAERLGVNASRVRQLILDGALKATKFGKSHQISEADLKPHLVRPKRGPVPKRKKPA